MLQSRHAHANKIALVAIVTLTLFAMRASIPKHFVAFTYNRICAVPLRAAGGLQVSAFLIDCTLFVAVQKMWASFVDAASAHALETKCAHIWLLLLTMQANRWINAAVGWAAESRIFTVLIPLAEAKILLGDFATGWSRNYCWVIRVGFWIFYRWLSWLCVFNWLGLVRWFRIFICGCRVSLGTLGDRNCLTCVISFLFTILSLILWRRGLLLFRWLRLFWLLRFVSRLFNRLSRLRIFRLCWLIIWLFFWLRWFSIFWFTWFFYWNYICFVICFGRYWEFRFVRVFLWLFIRFCRLRLFRLRWLFFRLAIWDCRQWILRFCYFLLRFDIWLSRLCLFWLLGLILTLSFLFGGLFVLLACFIFILFCELAWLSLLCRVWLYRLSHFILGLLLNLIRLSLLWWLCFFWFF